MKTLFEVMTSPSQRIFKDSFSSVHCTSESVKLIVHCTLFEHKSVEHGVEHCVPRRGAKSTSPFVCAFCLRTVS